jgi:DNA-binding NtrC family response regulator
LFVDADDLVARSLRRMLSALRPAWRLSVASSADDACDRIARERFDVVVADAQFLEATIPGFLQIAKASSPRTVRVVHCVAAAMPVHEIVSHTAQFVLNRPLDPGDFLSLLDSAIEAAHDDDAVEAC